jgi:predicted nucleic acid-binding protein/ribosomal protein S18 acetylase RimI-like enzyme
MKIEFIDNNNSYFYDVVTLWRKNSNTLGFMPEGGFVDYAMNHNIIIAYNNSELLGYLMFRIVYRYFRITIVHLCINEQYRGKHIAKQLLDTLVEKYRISFYGICLRCRDDYLIANSLWEKYGFVCKRKDRSKSIDERYLNQWWYDFNKPDLFTSIYQTSKMKALLDANIIFKLRDVHAVDHAPTDIGPLLLDWLLDEVDFFYAPELFNEILRDKDLERAEKTRNYLGKYIEARSDINDRTNIIVQLKKIVAGDNENDNSDRNQLATCIASGISYFITLDKELLEKKDKVASEFGIQLFTPQEFVLEIDQLINKERYSPKMLDGVVFHNVSKVKNTELNDYIDLFLIKSRSEKKTAFQSIVNTEIAKKKSNLHIIKNENKPTAFYAYNTEKNILSVPFIRLHENKCKQTLFMHIISRFINLAINDNILKIVICEQFFTEEQKIILLQLGFENDANIWTKLIYNTILDSNEAAVLGNEYLNKVLSIISEKEHPREFYKSLLTLERKYFPLKFTNLDIPCYIIPIKAYWAGQLFEINISNETLFRTNPNKIWNIENVYYRHAKPLTEVEPARILWYISHDKNISRSKAIVASSYLDEVITAKPKLIFKRYNHYGIYEWKDIFYLCNQNIKTNIRALKFSGTEVFKTIVDYQDVQEILIKNGKAKNTFVSPLRISNTIFNQIYRMGTCKI